MSPKDIKQTKNRNQTTEEPSYKHLSNEEPTLKMLLLQAVQMPTKK
jgi:hypothetical protein